MNFIDMRTVILGYIISNAICAVVIGSLWLQGRRRFAGLGLWLADFVMQFVALLLVALRTLIPDFISATVSNAMIIGGTILLYMGLEQFVGKPSKQTHNAILLGAFTFIHAYFLLVVPSLDVRTIILSLGLLVICSQCAWLMLHRVDAELRSITRTLGIVFLVYCLVSIIRIFVDLIMPSGNDFFRLSVFETALVMIYQMLFIILALGLFLMVNRRLLMDLERDIIERKQMVELLSLSEEKFFKAFHASPDAITLSRMSDGAYVEVNDGFSRLYQYSREEALASSSTGLGIWADPQARNEFVAILQTRNHVRDFECNLRIKSGTILQCLVTGEVIYLNQEAHILSITRDITEKKKAEEKLLQLSRAVEQSPVCIVITNTAGDIEYVNPRFSQITGYGPEEAVGRNPRLLKSGLTSPETYRQLWDTITAGGEWRGEFANRKKNGELYYESASISPIMDISGSITHYIAVKEDITDSKRAAEKLQQLSRAVEQSPSSILITDTDGRIEYVNPRFTQLTGYSLEEVRGKNPRFLQSGQTAPETYLQLWEALTHGKEFRCEFVNKKKNGDLYYESAILSPIIDSHGVVTHYLAVNEDITERKSAEAQIRQLQEQLREQAIRDALTGLYNRWYLNESLERELARSLRENYPISFVMIDIDHFKRLNDTFGHLAGDTVLEKLAAQILSQSRAGDIICRYGGEEFLAVLPNTKAEFAFQIAERWRKAFQNSSLPIESHRVSATISCGISEFPLHGANGDELIDAADKAMYQAKAAGRNQVIIWRCDRVEKPASAQSLQ